MNFLKALLAIPRLFREELEFLDEDDIDPVLLQRLEEYDGMNCNHVWECQKCASVMLGEGATLDDICDYEEKSV